MAVLTLEVASLGNRCHLVHDGRAAVVVDPPRDVALVEDAARAAGLEIAAVAETHVAHDYLSGALSLSRRHGVDLLLSAAERVGYERLAVRDGDVLRYGGVEVSVLDAPGHTRHHQAFLARTDSAEVGTPDVLLSGGSLLDGTVGRTDLDDPRLATVLAEAQWRTVQRLATLDPATVLLPTHGPDSTCTSPLRGPAPTRTGPTTVGDQLATHPALTATAQREQFVTELVTTPAPPTSPRTDRIAALNRSGTPTARGARAVTADQVTDAVLAGAWVIDLRPRPAFDAGHLPGTVHAETGDGLAAQVGWLVPWGDDVVLLADSPEILAPALRDLARIGIDGIGAHVLAPVPPVVEVAPTTPAEPRLRRADWAAYREARRESLAAGTRPPVVVDVRPHDDWRDAHLPGALHLPVHEVETGVRRLPAGELWVHCRSGHRAGIAAALLHRAGRDVVHVDDAWERVDALHLETVAA